MAAAVAAPAGAGRRLDAMSDRSTIDRLNQALGGRYRIERELGRGGMAVVYLAEDLKHARRVALKVLLRDLTHEVGVDRFTREVRIAAGLSHPHILPLFDSGEADGHLYFVMPWVEGETLRAHLDREGRLPLEDAVRLVSAIADGLTRAHDAGVVHRDIKPENILLESGHPLIADFGIAQALDAAGDDRLTRTGVFLGTPSYVSPEQVSGDTKVDGRTDVYALGCLAYEMLAGDPPFTGGSAQAIIAGHVSRPVPPLRDARPDVPLGAQRAIERALAKDPDERFASAADFGAALADAVTATARATEQRRMARDRWMRRAGVTAVLAVVAVAGWWAVNATRSSPIQRLAVLPASNLTRDPEQEFFVDGVHEALVTELQRAGMPVVARQSVLAYRNSEKPIRQLAEELGVDALLQPVVGREGDSVVVDVSLYDRESDVAVWSASFAEPVAGVLVLYREISRRIADQIGAVLSADAEARLAERPVVDPQVYEAVLRGQFHLRRFTPQDFDLAQRYFETALALDSTYAPAHLGAAMVWGHRSQANLVPSEVAKEHGEIALERARALDPELVDRHHLFPGILFWGEWDWDAGIAALARALELDPGNAETHAYHALALTTLGRWEEADRHARLALELDPLNPFVPGMVGTQRVLAGRYEEAIRILEGMYAQNPGVGLGEAGLRVAYHAVGRHDDEFRITREHHAARGESDVVAALDAGLAEEGPHRALGQAADVLAETLPGAGGVRVAGYYALAGEWERALEWVQRAVEQRDGNVFVIGVVPILWPLHDDPRFQAIVEELGLPLLQPGV